MVAQGQWRDKGEEPMEHATYIAKPYIKTAKKYVTLSFAPRHDDPLSKHRLSSFTGAGGSGKTTRAIELFRQRDPLLFIPTHRLAKEMLARGVKALDLSQLLPLEWSNRVVARKDMTEIYSPCDHMGRGLHGDPLHPGNLP